MVELSLLTAKSTKFQSPKPNSQLSKAHIGLLWLWAVDLLKDSKSNGNSTAQITKSALLVLSAFTWKSERADKHCVIDKIMVLPIPYS